jgi:CSLREA domain-containing protein
MSRRLSLFVPSRKRVFIYVFCSGIVFLIGASWLSAANFWKSVNAKAVSANATSGAMAAPLVGGCAMPSFGAATNFAVGSVPESVAVGDFNRDGRPDLVTANSSSTNLSVLLGNGAGSFGAANNIGLIDAPQSIAVGDFNRDGNLDLTLANPNGDDVSILLGDGAGNFGGLVAFGTGMNPSFVAVGDFNRDGNPDLVTANQVSDNVSVLLGNGPGSFGDATNFGAGDQPISIAVGDFNRDGNLDLAVANLVSDNVSLLLGNGAGSFGAATNFAAGDGPDSIVTGDFNQDGNPDLAVAIQTSNQVAVLLGNGAGSFGAATSFGVGSLPVSVAAGDFNLDGKLDLATANRFGDNISILSGNGAGSFGAATGLTGAGTNPASIAVGDFNLDGKPDLATANEGSNNASVLLNSCNGAPCGATAFGTATDFPAGTGPVSVAKADFNRDGRIDLAVANRSSNNVSVLLGNGSGGFGAAANFNAGSTPQSVATGDFNLDGRADLVVANFSSEDVSVLLGNGSGGFGAAANFNVGGANPIWVEVADLNRDGRPDLAVANLDANTVTIRYGDGMGGFDPPNNYSAGASPASVAVGDFNQDGRPDLAVANVNSANVSVLLQNSKGGFGVPDNLAVGADPVSVKAADVNRDGRLDLVVANFASDNVSVLLGNGLGGFGAATNFNVGNDPLDLTVGDFNLDGLPDLAVANSLSNNVSILLGNGAGSFALVANYGAGQGAGFVVSGDFNQDGSPDLAVANTAEFARPGRKAASRTDRAAKPAGPLAINDVSVLLNTCYAGAQTITVTTTADTFAVDGQCSLREAIQAANTNVQVNECPSGASGLDVIAFNIGTGTPSIPINSALPNITEAVTINGATGGATRIELNGASAGAVSGIALTAGSTGSIIRSLVVNRFGSAGIVINSSTANTIQDCYSGLDASGTLDRGNATNGISITNGDNNLIGGIGTGTRNVIAGNDTDGIIIAGAGSFGNFVHGNYIGTNASGTGALGNTGQGINILSSAFNNIIGGNTAAERNVISGNVSNGINIGLGANNNSILGNYIGLDVNGTNDLGNSQSGVRLTGATTVNNVIGGTQAGARNVISGNNQNGVLFDLSNTNNRVEGNYIGLNSAGTAAIANSGSGVLVQNSDNITIGGTAVGASNLISGNTLSGITITGATAINNRVLGNSVFSNGALGLDLGNNGLTTNDAGDADTGSNNLQNFPVLNFVTSGGFTGGMLDSTVANSAYPVRIEFFANTTCDTSGNGEGEVLLGSIGVSNPGFFTFSFKPIGSRPFITATATDSNGNTSEFSSCRMVGDAPAQNIVVNTTTDAVAADGFCSLAEAIQAANTNAQINECNAGVPGLDNIVFNVGAGTPTISIASPLPAITEAVTIDGATGGATRIEINGGNQGAGVNGLTITGGNSTIRSLVINRFTGSGIHISDSGGNRIENCFLGVNAAGTAAQANTLDGIRITGTANNIIGGTAVGARNLIAGNGQHGIAISGAAATGNQVQGNFIGTEVTGSAALGNAGFGVAVGDAPGNTIGGTVAEARNLISGNGASGVYLGGNGATGNTVTGNYLGTDVNGVADLGNTLDGITIEGADNNFIGGTTGTSPGGACTGACNLAAGNNRAGIFMVGVLGNGATGNLVLGNFVGTNLAGTAAISNTSDGVAIQESSGNTIGGTTAAARNLISGNGGSGAHLLGTPAATFNNVVQGNLIGTDSAGATALANALHGVLITAAANNVVGGTAAGAGNLITGNGGAGVSIVQNTAIGNRVSGNSITANGGLGIDLGGAGVTPNDANDGDTGPNNLQNFPVLSSAVITGSMVSVQGTINSTANTVFRIEFFSGSACDASGNGEGQVYLGFTEVTTDAGGNAVFSADLPGGLVFGQVVTATATDPAGNTSEFSPCGCTFTLTPAAAGFDLDGGNGVVNVTTSGGCAWTAVSNFPWITVTGGGAGNGNGTVSYTVAANPLAQPRTGSISIAGFAFYITQAAGGTILNEDFNEGIPEDWTVMDGGTGDLRWEDDNPCNVIPGPPFVPPFVIVDLSCAADGVIPDESLITPPFDASGLSQVILQFDSWFKFTPGGLNVIGDVDVSTDGGTVWVNVLRLQGVNENPNTRTLDITSVVSANPSNVRVRFHYYAVGPRPAGPNSPRGQELSWGVDRPTILALSLGPLSSPPIPAAGDSGSVTVTVPAGYSWSAQSNNEWITLAASGGTGSGTLGYTVAAYNGSCQRSGSITIELLGTDLSPAPNAMHLVTQLGLGLTLNPASLPNGFAGSAYNQTLTPGGGTAPYTCALDSGSLPAGISLTGCALSGTPAVSGTSNFTIRVTDDAGCTGTRSYGLTVIGGGGGGLQFYPLAAPVRLLDTRSGGGISGCTTGTGALAANATRTQPARTVCSGIPANATALIGNITVVPSASGFLTLFPGDATQPTVANSNFKAGEVTNNFFTVGLDAAEGAFKIFSSAATEVIIDLTGYYAPPSPSGLYYHPLSSPVRLVETRSGQTGCFQPAQLAGTNNPNADPSLDQQVQGRGPGLPGACSSIPSDAVVLVGNATTVLPNAPLGFGYLTIYPSDAARPTVASSNYAGGDVINGPFAVKLGADGKFKIYTLATTHLVVDITGYYSASATDANGQGLLFNPLASPMRLLETRPDFPSFPLTGCYRPNAPIPGGTGGIRTQQVWGTCSDQPITIPNTARAMVGNVTVLNPVNAGFLTFFPGDVGTAPIVATSNYPFPVVFGYNRHYYVGLSPTDGTFKILTQFTADLIVDVSGYFTP